MKSATPSRIVVDPEVHFGKPCVRGTRIPVVNVLELVEQGLSFDQIRAEYYPALEADDIRACVRYAIELSENEEIHLSAAS
jgi:uncharacterized protein (DUF433 family)